MIKTLLTGISLVVRSTPCQKRCLLPSFGSFFSSDKGITASPLTSAE